MVNQFNFDNKPRCLIVSYKADRALLKELEKFGIPIILSTKANVDERINDHPDLQINQFLAGRVITSPCTYEYYKKKLQNLDIKVEKSKNYLSNLYPNDCMLNVFRYKDFYVTKKDVIDPKLEEEYRKLNLKPIYQKQAYANCMSICLKDLVITCDRSIEKALIEKNIDVQFISNQGILLDGHKTGFIGGACGIIDCRKILFTGDINNIRDGEKLVNILEDKGYEYFYPDQEIIDLGGIIPIY